MRHLIIGAGNMGRKHGEILSRLGDQVQYEDLGYDPRHYDYKGIDSILICTPPETHEPFIAILAPAKLPIFVEKPVTITQNALDYPGVSLGACNWRWCPDIRYAAQSPILDIACSYHSDDPYRHLDLIHFFDLGWHLFGRPVNWETEYPIRGDRAYLQIKWEHRFWDVRINFTHSGMESKTIINNRLHDSEICPMVDRQMEYWRSVVKHSWESWNTIPSATQRLEPLIRIFRLSYDLLNALPSSDGLISHALPKPPLPAS